MFYSKYTTKKLCYHTVLDFFFNFENSMKMEEIILPDTHKL